MTVPVIFNLGLAAYFLLTVALSALAGTEHGILSMMLRGGRDGVLVALLLALSVLLTLYGLRRRGGAGVAGRLLGAVLVGAAVWLYLIPAFAVVKAMVPLPLGYWADPLFAELDRLVHLGHDAWRVYWPLATQVPFQVHFIGYHFAWTVLALSLPVLATAFDPDIGRRNRVLVGYLFVWIGLGNLLAALFASVGPVYYADLTGIARYADYEAVREAVVPADGAVRRLQTMMWENWEERTGRVGFAISAFPSVHVGMAALVMVYLVAISRLTGLIGIGYLALTQLTSVSYGWHYAVDGYASIALVVLVWWASGRIVTRSRPRVAAAQAD